MQYGYLLAYLIVKISSLVNHTNQSIELLYSDIKSLGNSQNRSSNEEFWIIILFYVCYILMSIGKEDIKIKKEGEHFNFVYKINTNLVINKIRVTTEWLVKFKKKVIKKCGYLSMGGQEDNVMSPLQW